jgi:hypothetical protein
LNAREIEPIARREADGAGLLAQVVGLAFGSIVTIAADWADPDKSTRGCIACDEGHMGLFTARVFSRPVVEQERNADA